MSVAFIVLTHDNENCTKLLIDTLLHKDAIVALHLDRKSGDAESTFGDLLSRYKDTLYLAEQVDVKWGEWSMLEATLACINLLLRSNVDFTHIVLLSGSCFPIKPFSELQELLDRNRDIDFIDITPGEQRWVVDGLQNRRWSLYHYINWRSHPKLYSWVVSLQSILGVSRKLPKGFQPAFGSQWWALKKETLQRLINDPALCEAINFYKRTWIPDEMFFQSYIINQAEYKNKVRPLVTHYEFDREGLPKEFFNDSASYLPDIEDKFFARKLSPTADKLRKSLRLYFLDGVRMNDAPTEDFVQSKLPFKIAEWPDGYEIAKCCPVPIHFFVLAHSEGLLSFADKLNKTGVLFHHDLFNKQKIGFLTQDCDVDRVAGFSVHDIARRDFSQERFLIDILVARPDVRTIILTLSDTYILKYYKWVSVAKITYVSSDYIGSEYRDYKHADEVNRLKVRRKFSAGFCAYDEI